MCALVPGGRLRIARKCCISDFRFRISLLLLYVVLKRPECTKRYFPSLYSRSFWCSKLLVIITGIVRSMLYCKVQHVAARSCRSRVCDRSSRPSATQRSLPARAQDCETSLSSLCLVCTSGSDSFTGEILTADGTLTGHCCALALVRRTAPPPFPGSLSSPSLRLGHAPRQQPIPSREHGCHNSKVSDN